MFKELKGGGGEEKAASVNVFLQREEKHKNIVSLGWRSIIRESSLFAEEGVSWNLTPRRARDECV
jgi:hypothetical protein